MQIAKASHKSLLSLFVPRISKSAFGSPDVPGKEGDVFEVEVEGSRAAKHQLFPLSEPI